MTLYINTATDSRIWVNLTNPETGRTLELQPNETAELDLGDEFEDPFLKPTEEASAPVRKPWLIDPATDLSYVPEAPEEVAPITDPAEPDAPAEPNEE